MKIGCPKHKLVYNVSGPRNMFETITPQFSKKQFIAAGSFTNKKAPYYTIIGFKEVVKNHPNVGLLMAGYGALLNIFRNLVKYYKLEEHVKFLDIVSPEVYGNLLNGSLAFVNTLLLLKTEIRKVRLHQFWKLVLPDFQY